MGGLIRIVLVFAFAGGAYAALQSNVAPAATARATASGNTGTPAGTTRIAVSVPATATVPPRPTPAVFALTMSDADLPKAAAASFPPTVNGVTVREPNVSVANPAVRLTAPPPIVFCT